MNRQIVRPPKAVVSSAESAPSEPDDYKNRLIKHIPTESIAAYVTLQGIIESSARPEEVTVWLWIAFGVGIVGTPLYLMHMQQVTSPAQLAISTASFAIWVYSLGGAFARYSWYEAWTASVILTAFTFLSPQFLTNKKQKPGSAPSQ